MTSSQRSGRTALIAVLGLLGAIPVASGTAGVLGGTASLPGGMSTAGSVDSEYRFVNLFWATAGGVLWWSLGRPEDRAAATRLVLAVASIGGFARLLSWLRTGAPHPVFQGTIVLELVVVPIVLAWHSRVFPARR